MHVFLNKFLKATKILRENYGNVFVDDVDIVEAFAEMSDLTRIEEFFGKNPYFWHWPSSNVEQVVYWLTSGLIQD